MNKFFSGTLRERPQTPAQPPAIDLQQQRDPSRYEADEGLVSAVNVSLILRQPLLLTGEPGTGKTQLADRLAWERKLDDPLVFDTKSTCIATDLYYTFDAVGYFNSKSGKDAREFVAYNALGEAILRSQGREANFPYLSDQNRELLGPPKQSVVLIDEIDKAPRDFPNDLLNQIDRMYFRIPEIGPDKIYADKDLRPIVVITSNSEKVLPDPFLRRCIYYHIPFPNLERLERIVLNRVRWAGSAGRDSTLIKSSLDFFSKVRALPISKKPSTAELINWLTVLVECGAQADQNLQSLQGPFEQSVSALIKTSADMAELDRLKKTYFRSE